MQENAPVNPVGEAIGTFLVLLCVTAADAEVKKAEAARAASQRARPNRLSRVVRYILRHIKAKRSAS
jgi:hypothetical protein